ncbi:SGNH/GDSL hydrolase family protein [Pseudomonas juntendi]|uniref:SGNH/GDSL hydrolase family protein n=1 Tax=Pseudomonas juntendi TaxID=2666183 RepID=UPI0018D6ABB3|nr:GDSL-type esterase/lipase family protein [Pseudomonas juntendi]MBH3373124.1 hypothetical protein [Pseudomonas juntendi]
MELKNFFVQDDQGNVLPGATCYLYEIGTENVVEKLFRPNGTRLSNPFTAGNDGLVQFAAANGKYHLQVVTATRNNRIYLQFNDVSDDLAAARAAATQSENARDIAQLSAGIYGNAALGVRQTVSGQYFSVPSDDDTEFLILYENSAGVAVERKRYPAASAINGALATLDNIQTNALFNDQFEDTTQFHVAIYGEDGIALAANQRGEIIAGGVNVTELSERTTDSVAIEHDELISGFTSDDGQSPMGFDESGDTHIGRLEMETRDMNEHAGGVLMPITDAAKNLLMGFDRRTGQILANFGERHVTDVSTYVDVPPTVSGLKVKLSGSYLVFAGQPYPLADVTMDAAATAIETVQAYPLKFLNYVTHPVQRFADIDAATWLGYSSVEIKTVKKASDNSAMVLGRDVTYSENGKLVLMRPGADVSAIVNYVGKKERYDLIVFSLVTNALVVRKGVERRSTAHEDLYRAKPQVGDIVLYSVYVSGGAIREIVKLWNWRGVRNKDSNAEQTAMFLENRRRLSRFLNKLHARKGVIVTGYGDSNTALGGDRAAATVYLPNRPGTDTLSFQGPYMLSSQEEDFRTAYLAQVGSVVMNGETRYKTGPNWQVIDTICASHGYDFVPHAIPADSQVTYLNHGISSSTAAATAYNGLYPDRLNAMLSPKDFRKPDLVILGFGMNDGAVAAFVSDISQIIQAIKAAGVDVMLVGPHWTNSNGIRFTEADWQLIHRRLSEVAEFHEVAYLPSPLFYAGESRGYLGISDYSLTRANWINHPGPYEYRMNGVALAQYFK